jgi:hypothetical protein
MSAYVPKVMQIILKQDMTKSTLVEKRSLLIDAITHNIPTDFCIEALSESWSIFPHTGKVDLPLVMSNIRMLSYS